MRVTCIASSLNLYFIVQPSLKDIIAYHIHDESFGSTLKPVVVVLNHGVYNVASSNPTKKVFFTRGVWQNKGLGPPLILP